MSSYRDTTFCASEVTKHTCGREFTDQDAIYAEEWWGGKDYPVAYSEFCKEADNTQTDHIVHVNEMVTDTNQASELCELCKEVYEKTGWIVGDESWEWHTTTDAKLDSMFIAPKYYTDYLLEKLQSWFYDMGANDFGQFGVTILADGCIAKVRSHDKEFSEQASADTLLLALLKLTIALSEAGELK